MVETKEVIVTPDMKMKILQVDSILSKLKTESTESSVAKQCLSNIQEILKRNNDIFAGTIYKLLRYCD